MHYRKRGHKLGVCFLLDTKSDIFLVTEINKLRQDDLKGAVAVFPTEAGLSNILLDTLEFRTLTNIQHINHPKLFAPIDFWGHIVAFSCESLSNIKTGLGSAADSINTFLAVFEDGADSDYRIKGPFLRLPVQNLAV